MNYYAQGGQAHGLKSIARDLQSYGRNGDTMLAHINPQEAAILKALGGSGTINPHTGLREYGWFKSLTGISTPSFIKKIDDVVVQPIAHAAEDVVKPILPYVQYIAPFIPGIGPLAAAGLGALGSGFAGGGGFNFKRGLMGGMTAYGLSNLYAGMQAAGGATPGAVPTGAEVPPVELGVPGTDVVAGEAARTGLQTPGAFDQLMAGDISGAAGTAGQGISEGVSRAYSAATNPETYSSMGDKFTTQASNAGQGIKNLVGLGEGTAAEAAKAFTGSGATMANTVGAGFMGYTGQEAIKEAELAKLEADLANAKSQAEYDAIMARIEAAKQRSIAAMQASPYKFAQGGEVPRFAFGGFNLGRFGTSNAPDVDPAVAKAELLNSQRNELRSSGVRDDIISGMSEDKIAGYHRTLFGDRPETAPSSVSGISSILPKIRIGAFRAPSTNVPPLDDNQRSAFMAMINNPWKYAYGGSVDDEPGTDDLSVGGVAAMAKGGMPPRFLSGGGDGMSDDIPAVIGNKQPARLADGEFVIPADVVSHLGNGSSKAGAKQLYSMMDKVRTARTGTKKQGKQINPAKYMPA